MTPRSTVDANAGAFALNEQSSYGQGSAYAGIAAGGDLSSMFWNPATMTLVPGIQTELVATGIIPYISNTPNAASPGAFLGGSGNVGDSALVPSGYASWQINPNLWLGLSLNSPFGLSVSFPNQWAGSDYAAGSSSIKTYNTTPSFAYRFNDMISVGFGVQFQYAKADITTGPGLGAVISELSGNGWGYGFTAGITLTPTPTTTIGLGYRSAINQKIDGTLAVTGLPTFAVSTTVNLPDTVSLGLRQRLTSQWTGLATIEWTNWSRIGTATLNTASGAPALVNGAAVILPFQFEDGWLFSVGAEYQWADKLAVRGASATRSRRSPIRCASRCCPTTTAHDYRWEGLINSARRCPSI